MSLSGRLVEWARAVLTHPELGVVGAWPRAAALLGRQALEEGIDDFWGRNLPNMKRASRTTQLACLDQYLGDSDLVNGVRIAWAALSRACHHHAYELSPTAPELDHWLATVESLVERLDRSQTV